MKRRFRLTNTTDYKRVRQQGKSIAHPLMVLVALPNLLDRSRIAVTASRSVGSAVQRNRAKRLIREAIRQSYPLIKPGWDVILICRKNLLAAPFSSIHAAVFKLLQSAHLTRE